MHKTNKFIIIFTIVMFFVVGSILIVMYEDQELKSWFLGNQSLDNILNNKEIKPLASVEMPSQANEVVSGQKNNLAQKQTNSTENQLPSTTTSTAETETEETMPVSTVGKITLAGKKTATGIKFSWKNSKDLVASHGFKIVKSKNKNPSYPEDDNQYVDQETARSYEWAIADGKKYHFRVCAYDGSEKCLVYSNDVSIKAPDNNSEDYATSVNLSGKKEGDDVKLSWTIAGGSAPKGFRLVMSKEENPEYPSRLGDYYHYLSDPNVTSDVWKKDDLFGKLETGNTYYFRVCVYKGDSCGVYSDNVMIAY